MATTSDQCEGPAIVQEECPTHGPFESQHIIGGIRTQCPACVEEDRAAKPAPSAPHVLSDADRHRLRLSAMGISPRFMKATLGGYRVGNPMQGKALAFCETFVSEFAKVRETGRSAMFIGKPGTGKTHLAVGILRALADDRNFKGRIISAMAMFRRVKETWSRDAIEKETDAIFSFIEPHLLVIDEVGVQFGSAAEANLFYEIVNERYVRMLPTILISNLSPDEVKNAVGDRVYDRLRDNGGRIIPFGWESARG